jgi:hypothetical protein
MPRRWGYDIDSSRCLGMMHRHHSFVKVSLEYLLFSFVQTLLNITVH